VLITCRVPEGQELLKLPAAMPTPTGVFDHPSHHATPGQVPQMFTTRVQWFLNGGQATDGNFEVRKGDAESGQVKYQVEHGARPETRDAQGAPPRERGAPARTKGADISDLQGPRSASPASSGRQSRRGPMGGSPANAPAARRTAARGARRSSCLRWWAPWQPSMGNLAAGGPRGGKVSAADQAAIDEAQFNSKTRRAHS
jgi:hypothetical protein